VLYTKIPDTVVTLWNDVFYIHVFLVRMVFSSVTFLFFFLPIVIIGFLLLPQKFKKWYLMLASLFFYTWGEGAAIVILLFSICITYLAAKLAMHNTKKKKVFLISAIVVNVCVLGVFKYADFLISSINTALHISIPLPGISLPLGISFFTFQTISYLIDVYRDSKHVEHKFSNFLLYISFFPQLIAGPIVRHSDIADNIDNPTTTTDDIAIGLQRFIVGLAKKVLIADAMAVVADSLFAMPAGEMSLAITWIAMIAYGLQIYFDFSGYSDMAIGLGRIAGFTFPENFNYPYTARSIQDFWRRWHITLSTWIRDYLYIPLGGSRKGEARTYINLILVFALCGLWHGAAWTFVVWGAYYGVLQSIERIPMIKNVLAGLPAIAQHIYTLLVVFIGWIFFRAETFAQGFAMTKNLFVPQESGIALFDVVQPYYMVWMVIAIVLSIPYPRIKKFLSDDKRMLLRYVGIIVLLLIVIVKVSSQQYSPFIYFRF